MTRDEFADLFEIQVRGTIAAAFAQGNVSPTKEHWEMMRGDREVTMQDMGEIGHLTGFNMELHLRARQPQE